MEKLNKYKYCQRPDRPDVHQVLGIHELMLLDQMSLEQRLNDLESGASVRKIILNLNHF